MTPQEHYREAERLTEGWQSALDGFVDGDAELAAQITIAAPLANQALAAAQVHATLAAAGATFLAATNGYETARDQLGDAIAGGAR